MEQNIKSGFVTLIGRPNVGKSTLMNHLIGQKIAITSKKPQTTRNRIQTVYTEEKGQIIFVDTPGIHKAKNKLGEYSVAYLARVDEFDCGIMISASHNPYYDNGIKLINSHGEKMEEDTISLIEDYIDGKLNVFGENYSELPYARREKIGRTVDFASGRNRYIGYLISLGMYSFRGMRVGLDCANGCSWNIAKSVFEALGATTYVINAEPDGFNINENAGSTHIESLQKLVKEKKLDVGFAYDGDADRCLCVDEKGNAVTGDQILYVYGLYMKDRDKLVTNTVVTTIMSNLGLYKAFDAVPGEIRGHAW